MILTISLLTSCLKAILMPSYRSTDFEVHRNWLAVTHSLPVKRWYFESTSPWTLDYPPLFAWFEFLLSHFGSYFDKNMLRVENLNYDSEATVLFQRLSVIITDVVYIIGSYKCCTAFCKTWRTDNVLPLLLITNCGLLMIDHIHFQYNGIMYGILLLSVADMIKGSYLKSAFWFTILLNMKHIFIYLAPAYFIYLLRKYCLNAKDTIKGLINLTKLGSIVLVVFIITYLPFYDHIPQVLSRLFPFKRGLCHAYWAPNIWALYNAADKVLSVIQTRMGYNVNASTAAMTGGLVQEYSHFVLPNVTPLATMFLTVMMLLPCLVKLWRSGNVLDFLRCLVLCGLTSFMFGWHVHEKAILMAIIPLSVLAVLEGGDAKAFLILSTVGHFSLFPLLYVKSLLLIKIILFLLYTCYAFYSMSNMYPLLICKYSLPLLNTLESLYLLGLGFLLFYENVVHSLLGLDKRYPFLPLLITSVYCALGITYCWLKYYLYFLYKKTPPLEVKTNK